MLRLWSFIIKLYIYLCFAVKYLHKRIQTLWTQFTKAKTFASSGSEAISPRQMATYKKQVKMLGFLEPYQRKRKSKSNLVSFGNKITNYETKKL